MHICTIQVSDNRHESTIMIRWCLMSVHTLNVVAVRTSVGCCVHAVHHKRNPEAKYTLDAAQDHAPKPCLTLQIGACACNNTSHAISTNYLSRRFTKKRLCNHLRRTTLVKKQVSEASGTMCKLGQCIPFRSLKTIHYSLVYSHLRYAITSWGSSSFSTLNTLNIIHNKLFRIMTFTKLNANVCKLYNDTQIPNIDRIVKLQISKLMYKINF